jgi:hypothetical protein
MGHLDPGDEMCSKTKSYRTGEELFEVMFAAE